MLSWLFSDPLPVGSEAPDFTLYTQNGEAVALSALRGKNVVLVFYPGDDTMICRQQSLRVPRQLEPSRSREHDRVRCESAERVQSRAVSR